MSATRRPPTCARPPRRVERVTECVGGFIAWLQGVEEANQDLELRGHRVLAAYGVAVSVDRPKLRAILTEAQP